VFQTKKQNNTHTCKLQSYKESGCSYTVAIELRTFLKPEEK